MARERGQVHPSHMSYPSFPFVPSVGVKLTRGCGLRKLRSTRARGLRRASSLVYHYILTYMWLLYLPLVMRDRDVEEREDR